MTFSWRRKWPATAKVFLVLAAVFGLSAFALVHGYAARLEASRPEVGPQVPVLVASADLVRGTTVSEGSLDVVSMPSAFVPPGALSSPSGAVGRVLVSDVAQGEVLTRTRLSAPGSGPVAALVPPGLRAFVVSSGVPAGSV